MSVIINEATDDVIFPASISNPSLLHLLLLTKSTDDAARRNSESKDTYCFLSDQVEMSLCLADHELARPKVCYAIGIYMWACRFLLVRLSPKKPEEKVVAPQQGRYHLLVRLSLRHIGHPVPQMLLLHLLEMLSRS